MPHRPNVTLTELEVLQILGLLDAKVPQRKIAELYAISTKTINRISTGESWNDISQRHYQIRTAKTLGARGISQLVPIPEQTLDLLDDVIAVKKSFAFSYPHPIHWGWFDSWDGLHAIATDGIIAWESCDLVNYAMRLNHSGIDASPVCAMSARELPTRNLEDIFTKPITDKLSVVRNLGGIIQLVNEHKQPCFLQQKYFDVATRLHLELYQAGSQLEYLYFLKTYPKTVYNDQSNIITCVATVEL
jgi:hypothetical protein